MQWKPDRPVSETLALQLIEAQFPELKPISIQPVSAGWDNVVYRVNAEWFFRFPVRGFAVPGVKAEIACLPILARIMPEIAAPQFVGGPSADYPWPFFGYRPIPGCEACEVGLSDRQRTALAAPLARFLKRLHSARVAEPLHDHLPGDVWGRLDMAKRVPQAVENFRRLSHVYSRALPISESIVEEIAADALNTRPLPAVAVVHGDFHFRHVIVNEHGAWAGAIDWGDMHLGNPALDLQIAWSLLPPEARGEFWSEYGPVTDDQLAQARLLALYLALILFEYGLVEKLEAVRREAEWALQNLDPQRPNRSSAIIAPN